MIGRTTMVAMTGRDQALWVVVSQRLLDDALAGPRIADDNAQAALLAVHAQGIEDLLLVRGSSAKMSAQKGLRSMPKWARITSAIRWPAAADRWQRSRRAGRRPDDCSFALPSVRLCSQRFERLPSALGQREPVIRELRD